MAALVPAPGQATYSAAKMAIRGYGHALATEIAGTYVVLNCEQCTAYVAAVGVG
jgi:short-subunit dehydrogenase